MLAAPALIETYAVLTRLPAPYRLAPSDALALLDQEFLRAGEVIALDAHGYLHLLRNAPPAGIRGGRTYDAVIAACAVRGGASALLTLNPADFTMLEEHGIAVVLPGRGAVP
jgi:predicted nucleic acid-binding protein